MFKINIFISLLLVTLLSASTSSTMSLTVYFPDRKESAKVTYREMVNFSKNNPAVNGIKINADHLDAWIFCALQKLGLTSTVNSETRGNGSITVITGIGSHHNSVVGTWHVYIDGRRRPKNDINILAYGSSIHLKYEKLKYDNSRAQQKANTYKIEYRGSARDSSDSETTRNTEEFMGEVYGNESTREDTIPNNKITHKEESKKEEETRKPIDIYKVRDSIRFAKEVPDYPQPKKKKPEEGLHSDKEIDELEELRRKKVLIRARSGLKASWCDDNKQFNYFLKFLEKYEKKAEHLELDISERMIFTVMDSQDKPYPNIPFHFYDDRDHLAQAMTYADGQVMFFPSEYARKHKNFRVILSNGAEEKVLNVRRKGRRKHRIKLESERPKYDKIPLDIVFILDTTWSMLEEIERLKKTIEIINLNIMSLNIKPRLRFGMVLFRDYGDYYVTKNIPLTSDFDMFQKQLNLVKANGGEDAREDLQSALHAAMKQVKWNENGIRLGYVITDAAPHLDYRQKYTYCHALRESVSKGIKLFTVGAGGLDIHGEYVLRQISQYTSGRYIFLTYGESIESDGGKIGSVSHHTGDNFQSERLEAVIIKTIKDELRHLDENVEEDKNEDYFTAIDLADKSKKETLKELFCKSIDQLADYSSYKVGPETPMAILPLKPAADDLKANAEYFSENLAQAGASLAEYTMVEREDIIRVLKEQELTLAGLPGEETEIEAGRTLAAEIMVIGKLFRKEEEYECYMKLVRVETAEVIAVTKLKIDLGLGL